MNSQQRIGTAKQDSLSQDELVVLLAHTGEHQGDDVDDRPRHQELGSSHLVIQRANH